MKHFYNAQEIAQIMQISESKAYCFIREMNAELQEAGYLTVRGRVPVQYVRQRFMLEEVDHAE